MNHLQSMFIGGIAGLIPLLPMMMFFHFIMLRKSKRNHRETEWAHRVVMYLFGFVLLCILSVTGMPSLYDITFDTTVNVVPLVGIGSNFSQYMQNVLLFIPLGFLLPVLWKKFEHWRSTLLYGFLFTLWIEIMQIFTFRTTDIDDLLMNTAGTLLGFFLFTHAKENFPEMAVFSLEHSQEGKWEPPFCFGLAWLIMFFIQPPVSSWMWRFVLG